MADDQFAAREKDFNSGLGDVVGGFALGLTKADAMQADAVFQRFIEVMDPEKYPNVEQVMSVSLIGHDKPLETRISVPALVLMPTDGLVADEATLSMDMSVTARQEDTSSLNAKIGAKGSAGVGFGPFQAKVQISAEMSVSKDSKRSSDYTSTTHAELKMRRMPLSEGCQMLIDAANKTVRKGLELNDVILQQQVQAAAADAGVLPPTEGDEGGGGDTGGGGDKPAPPKPDTGGGDGQ